MANEHSTHPDVITVLHHIDDTVHDWVVTMQEHRDCVRDWKTIGGLAAMTALARDLTLVHAVEHGHTQAEFGRAIGSSKQAMHQRVAQARSRIEKAAHLI